MRIVDSRLKNSSINLRDDADFGDEARVKPAIRLAQKSVEGDADKDGEIGFRSGVRVSQMPGGGESTQDEFRSSVKVLQSPGGGETKDNEKESTVRGVKVTQSPGGDLSDTTPDVKRGVRVMQSPGGDVSSSDVAPKEGVRVTQDPGGKESVEKQLAGGVKTGYKDDGEAVKKALEYHDDGDDEDAKCVAVRSAKDKDGDEFGENLVESDDAENVEEDEKKDENDGQRGNMLWTFESAEKDRSGDFILAPEMNYKEYSLMLYEVVNFLRAQSLKNELIVTWFEEDLPSVVRSLDYFYLRATFSDEHTEPPALPSYMSSFLSPLSEIKSALNQVEVTTARLRELHTAVSVAVGDVLRIRKLCMFKYNAMRVVGSWACYIGLSVESVSRSLSEKLELEKIDSIHHFQRMYGDHLEQIAHRIFIKTETLNQGKLPLVVSQLLTLATSTASFITANATVDSVDTVKEGVWEYLEDKIDRFHRAKKKCLEILGEMAAKEEEGRDLLNFLA